MDIRESGEMYLETILILSRTKPSVRSIDVAQYMNFSKPSVSHAMTKLKDTGHVLMDRNGFLTLTEKGKEIAEKIYERHVVLCRFLTSIGVCEDTAEADACRMEHVISDESFNSLKRHLNAQPAAE